MDKKIRTYLFLACVILFFALSPAAILYLQGYRLDWNAKRMFQTGAFYFKTAPRQAEVFVNDKSAGKTDFFFGGILLENLIPQKYGVEIKKENYLSWKKNLEIKEKMITSAENIFLIPEKLQPELIGKNIDDFWPSPDGKKIILRKTIPDEKITGNENWRLSLYRLPDGIESEIINAENLVKFLKVKKSIIETQALEWSSDSNKILLTVSVDKTLKRTMLNLEENPVAVIDLEKTGNLGPIFLHPVKPNSILLSEERNGLFFVSEMDIKEKTKNKIIEDSLAFAFSPDYFYQLDKNGFLHRNNWNENNETLNVSPLELKETAKYSVQIIKSDIFVSGNQALFYFDPDSRIFKGIGERGNPVQLSPNERKITFLNSSEIWVYFLKEDKKFAPVKKKGEKILIARLSEPINDIFWFNDYYLLFNTSTGIKIAETDERDFIQIWDMIIKENQKLFFSSTEKTFYFLSGENFFKTKIQ